MKEKDDAARLTRQRPILRVCSELALVGIIRDAPGRSGGEWIMKTIRQLVRYASIYAVVYVSHARYDASYRMILRCRHFLSYQPF